MLNYDDANLILTINEHRNFSKASKSLYIGQSALSKKVREIESDLGYQIFLRSRGHKSVELTQKGSELIPILNQLKRINTAAYDIRNSNYRTKLSIASSDGPYLLVIDDAIEDLYAQNNQRIFKLKALSYRECINAVAEEIVDIAFIGNSIYRKNIDVVPLYKEQMVFICMAGQFSTDVIDPLKLDVCNAVYSSYSTQFSSWFASTFRNKRPFIQCDLLTEVKRYMKSLNLWSIVPASVADYLSHDLDITILPLDIDIPPRVIYYAVKNNCNNPSVNELLDSIKGHLASNQNILTY